jgi:hypothetical protein
MHQRRPGQKHDHSDGVQHPNGGDRAIKASGFDGQPANKCRARGTTERADGTDQGYCE